MQPSGLLSSPRASTAAQFETVHPPLFVNEFIATVRRLMRARTNNIYLSSFYPFQTAIGAAVAGCDHHNWRILFGKFWCCDRGFWFKEDPNTFKRPLPCIRRKALKGIGRGRERERARARKALAYFVYAEMGRILEGRDECSGGKKELQANFEPLLFVSSEYLHGILPLD